MENASKALLIAGSVLIAILILSLLVYAFNVFSEYQTSKDELDLIEDISKFNEQFTNYDRDNVRGYELISFVNQVIDYNKRRTNAEGAVGEDKYTPVTVDIVIDQPGEDKNRKSLTKDDNIQAFTNNMYKIDATKRGTFGDKLDDMQKIEGIFGGATAATNLAKSYNEIYYPLSGKETTPDEIKLKWVSSVKLFNNYCEDNSLDIEIKDDIKDIETEKLKAELGTADRDSDNIKLSRYNNKTIKEAISKYYEYMQFKRCVFISDSNAIQYDDVSGRIKYMKFTFNKIE